MVPSEPPFFINNAACNPPKTAMEWIHVEGTTTNQAVHRLIDANLDRAREGLRVSLGPETKEAEIVRFMDVFERVVGRIRNLSERLP